MFGLGFKFPQLAAGGLSLEAQIRELFANGEQGGMWDFTSPEGLYQDAVGTTPVTAVGQPVGLVLDRRFGLERGPELVPDGFSVPASWSSTSGWSIVGGEAVKSAGPSGSLWRPLGLVAGRVYEVRFDVRDRRGGSSLFPYAGNATSAGPLIAGDGPYRAHITAGTGGDFGIRGITTAEAVISNPSIREVPGNHASQQTTTARPTLRSGPLRIDYDGVDDFLRTTFPSALGSNVTIARSIPGEGAQILTGQTVGTEWDDNVTSCATLVIDRPLTDSETALVTAFLNQQAGV